MAGRRRTVQGKTTEAKIDQAVQSVKDKPEFEPLGDLVLRWDKVLSTGSTLLDLAISGERIHGGGVPGGILMEVYGRSGSGKTSILGELCGSSQAKGGDISFQDPEARLDGEYAETYGVIVPKKHYHQPNTVTELFANFDKWTPSKNGTINVMAADSLAALSTELEMEKGDKMGMRRAKEFSQELRKHARMINKNNWLFACSNQVRQGDYGDITPGGKAVEFYSSLRVSVNRKSILEKEKDFKYMEGDEKKTGGKLKRAFGIQSDCIVTKSSIGKPHRLVPIYIVFGYGLDDVRANLQWIKDTLKLTTYRAVDKTYVRLDQAIDWIENNNLEDALREEVIQIWAEIEELFQHQRKKKRR